MILLMMKKIFVKYRHGDASPPRSHVIFIYKYNDYYWLIIKIAQLVQLVRILDNFLYYHRDAGSIPALGLLIFFLI